MHEGRCVPCSTVPSCRASRSPLLRLGCSLLLLGGVYRLLHRLWCCRGPRHGCSADLRVARVLRVVFWNRRVGEGAVMGLVMHPATSASCVPLTVPVSSIGIVLITVASLAVLMVVTGEAVVVFETALTWGVRLLTFLAEVVCLVALPCCVSVWVSVRVVLTQVVFNVQSTVFVVGHFALLFVVLQLVPLSRCQVGC